MTEKDWEKDYRESMDGVIEALCCVLPPKNDKVYSDAEIVQEGIDTIKELRTRVAELEKSNKIYLDNHVELANLAMKEYQMVGVPVPVDGYVHPIILKSSLKESCDLIAELQNRLSTLEKLSEAYYQIINTQEDKLSTLQKASEGMEKALDQIVDASSHKRAGFLTDQCLTNQIQRNQRFEASWEKAKSALADFRAVKEGK